LQAKLLRVLQQPNSSVSGEHKPISRYPIIAATNRDLAPTSLTAAFAKICIIASTWWRFNRRRCAIARKTSRGSPNFSAALGRAL